MDTKIEELQNPDDESLIFLLAEQFQESSCEIEKIRNRVSRCFQAMQKDKSLTFFVAVNSKIVIGYIIIHWLKELWTDFPEAFVSSFYVSLNWRNKGAGGLLLEAAISEAKRHNASRLFLENNRTNPIYQNQFYPKKGWRNRSDIAIFEFPLKEAQNIP